MNKSENVTVSFIMKRELYNAYKSLVLENGQNVKENLVRYMSDIAENGIPNPETFNAIQEVQALKNNPNKKVYKSFSEVLEELESEEN